MKAFKWKKMGFVFKPDELSHKLFSHTTPVSPVLFEDFIRIFYSPRTKPDIHGNCLSYISFVDVAISDPTLVIQVKSEPVFELGQSGTFDEHGTMVAEVLRVDGHLYMYYMGWQRLNAMDVPYQVKLGLAISDDNGETFHRYSEEPLIDTDEFDPISIGNVTVLRDHDIWKMWYTSYSRWEFGGKKPTPEYVIKYATSVDGINWDKTGKVCLSEDEKGGVATPTIWRSANGEYCIWYGYRKPYELDGSVGKYKLGFAKSEDGIAWQKCLEDFDFYTSEEEWDNQMMCYPAVVQISKRLYLFYCGNDFGRGGFGVAYSEIYD